MTRETSRPIPDTLAGLTVPIATLTPYEGNPRRRAGPIIRESLLAHGLYRPIVVNRGTLTGAPDVILAGNGTWAEARDLGWEEIAVTYVDVTADEAARIVLVDNRANDLAGYDDALLVELLDTLAPDLSATGYTEADLSKLRDDAEPEPGLNDPDAVPPVPVTARSRPGDLWLLGEHRVLCADVTDPGALDLLLDGAGVGCLLTDPPYGISLDTDYRSMGTGSKKAMLKGTNPKNYPPVHGDTVAFDPGPVLASALGAVAEQFWFGADYYRRRLTGEDRDGAWMVWDKRTETSDDGFGSGFELIWSRQPHQRRVLRHFHFGAFGADARNRSHPTQKPVPLLVDVLTRWAPKGGIVADPYAGSGSTLIAAHRSGRTGYVAEIEPLYVDVICRRYQEHTGTRPVHAVTGETADFTAPGEE